jgi:Uncharacterized protein containing a ferredoxin domain (DUF2148)
MRVMVLAVPGCPNAMLLEKRLEQVLDGRRDVTVVRQVVDDEREAARAVGEPVPRGDRRASRRYCGCSQPGLAGCAGRNGRGRVAPAGRGLRAVHQAVLRSFAAAGRAPEQDLLDEAARPFDTARVLAELAGGDFLCLDHAGHISAAYPFSAAVIADDPGTRSDLAAWMRARGKERRERIWFRDAEAAEALGIAVGSAAKTAAIHSVDCRCQTRVAVSARKLGLIQADHSVALSLSITHKAIGSDSLDLPPTGTLPMGVPGMQRNGGARNRQAPRRPIRPASS